MTRKKVYYPLFQIDMVGQLACEIQILRSIFPDDKHEIFLVVYPSSHFKYVNRSVFNNLTRGMHLIPSTNSFIVESNHKIRKTPDKIGIFESGDSILVRMPPEKMVELSISRFGRTGCPWHTSLNSEEKSAGLSLEKILGIPRNRKIVTIHVRNDESSGPYHYRYRNANISNYFQAIKYLLDSGYYVVRLGDKSMPKLPIVSPQLIDAPYNPYYIDFFDLYFIAESSFFIGMLSGPCSVAHSFWIPMLFTNAYYCYGQCGYDKGLMVPKKYFSRQLTRYLSYQEILFSPLINYNSMEQFDISEIEIHENSQEEILLAVIEMEKRLDNRYVSDCKLDISIDKIWDMFAGNLKSKKPVGGYNIDLMEYVQLSHEYIKLNPEFIGHNWPKILTDVHHAIL